MEMPDSLPGGGATVNSDIIPVRAIRMIYKLFTLVQQIKDGRSLILGNLKIIRKMTSWYN